MDFTFDDKDKNNKCTCTRKCDGKTCDENQRIKDIPFLIYKDICSDDEDEDEVCFEYPNCFYFER